MLQRYREVDYELLYLDKSRFSFLSKKALLNFYFFLNIPIAVSLYFIFANIIAVDLFYMQRFFLVL
jgi:hypothetical protein